MSWNPCLVQIAGDIPGCEGPLVTKDGRIFVVAPSKGLVSEILENKVSEFAQTGGTPAGLQLHPDGTIWVADMRRGILSVNGDGAVRPVVTEWDGQPIRGCNDCTFDSKGNLYFTAPAGSSRDNPCGEVFCLTHGDELVRIDGGFAFCNGIAISADDGLLVVAETFTKKLWGYRLDETNPSKFLFATVPGDHRGGPDGIDFDAGGNLLVANWGGGHLEVFSADGTLLDRISLPFEKPSNLHFLGPGSREILITEHSSPGLWKGVWSREGQRQYGWAEMAGPKLP